MLDDLLQMFAGRSIGQIALGVVDIIAVTIVIYRLLLVLKGTRAAQIGVGIFLVFLTYIAARWIGLVTLETLFSGLLSSAILLIIIVFQNDIRRALHRIGSSSFFGSWGHALEERVIEEVVGAATELARHRVGAIIAFERHANLDEFLSGQGIIVDAAVSKELLITTFIPESANKLHDGAVIIRDRRVWKAGCFLPLTASPKLDKTLGKVGISCADGMIYALNHQGMMYLLAITPTGFDVVSQFDLGKKPANTYLAHPVICGGRMYLRCEQNLLVYDIRAK